MCEQVESGHFLFIFFFMVCVFLFLSLLVQTSTVVVSPLIWLWVCGQPAFGSSRSSRGARGRRRQCDYDKKVWAFPLLSSHAHTCKHVCACARTHTHTAIANQRTQGYSIRQGSSCLQFGLHCQHQSSFLLPTIHLILSPAWHRSDLLTV